MYHVNVYVCSAIANIQMFASCTQMTYQPALKKSLTGEGTVFSLHVRYIIFLHNKQQFHSLRNCGDI